MMKSYSYSRYNRNMIRSESAVSCSVTRRVMQNFAKRTLMFSFILICAFGCSQAWGSEKIKLKDLNTLTLYAGKMTKGRRTAPVSQLECVGGSAGCSAFVPQVVQCYNRGFDGYDVQWECKTDMDNAYRFGRIEVTCEGYDYPDDEYVLKGSCGLRYTIDLIKGGYEQTKGYFSGHGQNYSRSQSGLLSDVIILIIVVIIIYAIIKTCLHSNQYSTTNDDYPQDDSRYFSGGFRSQAPPPPGFRTDYGASGGCAGPAGSSSSSGGGFWTGAMTGGLLGYMFGNRSNQGRYSSWGSYGTGTGYNSSYRSYNRSDSSSGTHTASGFGGTTRR